MTAVKDVLIVCYSYSGNTYQAAREIQNQTGGVLCEIYPRQPYPMIFTKLLEQVRKEIESGFRPHLFPIGEEASDYQTVFIGTPNWCGTIAPPVSSWLSQTNLAGKTVAPFYTHYGGGQGNIEADIRSLCPQAAVKRGISIINDGGTGLPEQIALWIEKIKTGQTEIERNRKYEEQRKEIIGYAGSLMYSGAAGRMSRTDRG